MAVLTVSTGCTSVPTIEASDPYRDVLVLMAPEAPAIPTFPALNWTHENDLYCLAEADADALLAYGENALPLFAHQYDQYVRQMRIILNALVGP